MEAAEADRALFAYADPGHETTTALHSWAGPHLGLWKALSTVPLRRGRRRRPDPDGGGPSADDPREVGQGIRADRTRARRHAARSPGSSGPSSRGDDHVLGEYGDLQAGLRRIVELKEKAREEPGRKLIRCGTTWQPAPVTRT